MQMTSNLFDQRAAGWDNNPGRVALARAVVAAIRDAVPLRPDMRVMDFGAGTGLVTLGLLDDVGEITAVDASAGMLRVLAEKTAVWGSHRVRTLRCDVSTEALPQAAFDLVVSSMTLHHLPDVPAVLKRLRASLRPGGWIALADLDTEDGSFHADKTGVYHCGFERAEVCRWLTGAGYAGAAARDAYRMTKPGSDGVIRDYPVFLATART